MKITSTLTTSTTFCYKPNLYKISSYNFSGQTLATKYSIHNHTQSKFILCHSLYLKSSEPEVFCKKGAVKTFAKFTGKQPVTETLFNKVAGLQSETLSEKRLRQRCFPVNFDKFLGTLILKNNCERLLLLFIIPSLALLFPALGFLSPFLKTYVGGIKVHSILVNVTIQRLL